ncbi:MAG: rod shape-determining protein MreD [Bacilli bacterium]|nr:rod shape-determining protein MreD [Bacilli bacterium]
MITIITIISFIFQYTINSYLFNSIFIPLTILMLLAVTEVYFDRKKKNYFIYAFVIGLFYDYLYTNTFFLNASIFLLLSFIIRLINNNITRSIFRLLIDILITIILYRTIFYLLYFIIGLVDFNFFNLLESIYKSLLLNIIYGYIIYYILYFCKHKKNK